MHFFHDGPSKKHPLIPHQQSGMLVGVATIWLPIFTALREEASPTLKIAQRPSHLLARNHLILLILLCGLVMSAVTGEESSSNGIPAAPPSTVGMRDESLVAGNDTPVFKRAKLSENLELCRSVTPHNVKCTCTATATTAPQLLGKMTDVEIKNLLREHAGYDVDDSSTQRVLKRSDYLSWDDYFMATAVLSSKRSKDPHHPCGCCIVDRRNRIVGIGYNGFPMQCSDDVLPWVKPAESVPFLHTYQPYVVHAIVNAILCSGDVQGARLYVSEFPCADCAKTIIQGGVSEVIYYKAEPLQHPEQPSDEDTTLAASRIMFQMAGVTLRPFVASQDMVQLVRTGVPEESPPITADSKSKKKDDLSDQWKIMQKEADLCETVSAKRPDYLTWDDYFMWMAFLTAQRSKDPNTQVGACLVLNQRIVGLGYNGFPLGCSDDHLPWARKGESPLHTKYPFVCHAEVNAIMNRIFPDIRGATLYVALFPCNECTKFIIQAGIRQVVYLDDKYHDTDTCRASRIMFQMAGVTLQQHTPAQQSLTLDLNCTQSRGSDKEDA